MEIQDLKQLASEAIASTDVSGARELLAELSEGGANPAGTDEAALLMRQLLFLRLPQITHEQVVWLVQHYVLEGFKIPDFDFPARVDDRISVTFEDDKRIELLRALQNAVEISQQQLGSQNLKIDGKDVPPLVQNWIRDYNFWPTQNKYRESLDVVNYADKAPNPQKLSTDDRALLIELLGWYDGIRNDVMRYEESEEIDLEEYPNLDPRLLTATYDEFESPEAAEKALDKAFTPASKAPFANNPSATKPTSEPVQQPVEVEPPARPNIQGVLSDAPIRKEDSGLGVASEPIKEGVGAQESKPTSPVKTEASTSKPASADATKVPNLDRDPVAEQKQQSVPAEVPHNLPIVAPPEPLPAVIPQKSVLPPKPKKPAKPSGPSNKPTFVPPPKPAQGSRPLGAPVLPDTLNMDQINQEVQDKKRKMQDDIEKKLDTLKKRNK